jgi:hypothetical protein
MKKLLLALGSICLVVLAAAAVVLKDRIREAWYLHRLDSEDGAERDAAAEKLVEIGSAGVIRRFLDIIVKESRFETPNVLAPPEGAPAGERSGAAFSVQAPLADGGFGFCYGTDVLCFESDSLCLKLIRLVDRLGAGGLDALRAGFLDGDRYARYLAMALIGRVGEAASDLWPEVREVVLDLEAETADPRWNYDYRIEASETLVKLLPANAERRVADLIELILTGENSAAVAGYKGLQKLGARCVPELVVLLRESLKQKDPVRRMLILEAFAHLGESSAAAVPAIAEVLKERERELRQLAVQVLFQIGPPAKDALPALRGRAEDDGEDDLVRQWAAQAIAEIEGAAAPPGAGAPGIPTAETETETETETESETETKTETESDPDSMSAIAPRRPNNLRLSERLPWCILSPLNP